MFEQIDQLGEILESIIEYIISNKQATLLQLSNEIYGFKGNFEWHLNYNTIIYSEYSKEAINIMRSSIECGLFSPKIVMPSDYLDNGFKQIYPLAKSVTRSYRRPHWIPLALSFNKSMIANWKEFPFDIRKSGYTKPMYRMWPECIKKPRKQ